MTIDCRDCLTTRDHAVLESILRRGVLDRPYARALRRKLANAQVVFTDDVDPDVATLNSRVAYSVEGRDDERVLSYGVSAGMPGAVLPVLSHRGLALLGVRKGGERIVQRLDGGEEKIQLHKVLYQPEAARRQRRKEGAAADRLPALLPHPRDPGPHQRLADDDPGPTAA